MDALVDTSIWSLALRRRNPSGRDVEALRQLILQDRAKIIGPIRQEILSGITDSSQFEQLRLQLREFTDVPLSVDHFEDAARYFNTCRGAGIQGSHVDFLICAVSHREKMALYTSDGDFTRYGKYIPIKFFEPS